MDQVEEGINIQVGRLPSYLKAGQQDEICATIVGDDDNTGTVGDDTVNQLALSALSARKSQRQQQQSSTAASRRRKKMILTALAVFAVLLIICALTFYGVSKSNNNKSTAASTGNFGGEEGEVVSSSMMEALDRDDLYEYEDLSIIETRRPSPSPVKLTISNDFEVGQPQSRRRRTDDDDDSEW